MCTLALALGSDRRFPVVVAANRAARLGRAAEGWALRDGTDGLRYAAPGDLLAGGTWIGLSARGVFAGLTNYHAPLDWYPAPDRRSRGEIVGLALAHPTAEGARAALAGVDPARYNPFHLAVADAAGGFLWWYDGERAAVEPLGPGLHVITEGSAHGDGPRGERVRGAWPIDPTPARLRELLAVHEGAGFPGSATCIHREPLYGTRSSAILRVAARVEGSDLLVADGPPCRAPFEDRGDLVAALARSA
jgi:uncharacterized protein with NRDE domain